MPTIQLTHRSTNSQSHRFTAFVLVAVSSAAGCVNLTEPWNQANPTGAGGIGQVVGTGGAGAYGTLDDAASGSGGLLDDGQGGSGGGIDLGSGGATVAIDAFTGGAGGSIDAPLIGTGGASSGGVMGSAGGRVADRAANGAADGAADGVAGGSDGAGTGVDGAGGAIDVGRDGVAGETISDTGGNGSSGKDAGLDGAIDGDTVDVAPIPGGGILSGLVVYYSCNQASGATLLDMSGNSPPNNGTLLDMPSAPFDGGSIVPGYSFAAGKVGTGSLVLSSVSNGYVSMPTNILAGATEATIATWVYLTTAQSYQRIFDIGIDGHSSTNPLHGTTNRYMNMVPATYDVTTPDHRKLGFFITNSGRPGEQSIVAPTVFPTATWTHVAVVLGPGLVSLYMDGALAATSTLVTLRPADLGVTDYAYIGKSQFSENANLDGQIDDFRVYNRALSSADIHQLYLFTGN